MKKCSKCGVEKDESEFSRDKNTKSGLRYYCKICVKEDAKQWRLENPEKVSASLKRYRLNNSEKIKEYIKQWRLENPEKVSASWKQYSLNNSEKVKACRDAYFKTDKYYFKKLKYRLKKQIGETPPPELVEVKLLINKTKRLCKTLKN